MEPDFSGWATKAGLKCSDGRVIAEDAFKHQDGVRVPLVWHHVHDSVENVLGYAVLEHREGGVYTRAYFNDTPAAQHAKAMVQHGDVVSLSIFANKLVERSKQVLHGAIREVSLVLSGANPGALIDFVNLAHSDGSVEELEDEAIIFTGLSLEHAAPADSAADTSSDNETVQDVYDNFSQKEKDVVDFMIVSALENAGVSVQHSDDASEDESEEETESDEEVQAEDAPADADEAQTEEAAEDASSSDDNPSEDNQSDDATSEDTSTDDDQSEDDNGGDSLTHQEGNIMTRNVFEQNGIKHDGPTLTHSQLETVLSTAKKNGSFKEALLAHAGDFGIDNIELLFPDAAAITSSPQFISRRMEWVAKVLDGTKHSPLAKVKTLLADITPEEARAKGYTKGNKKVEEVFALLKRTTSPSTIYKKQKLDRDDIIDITELDVVAWLQAEMRLMIEEEVARAILVGDGRSNLSEDKVKDPAGAVDGVGLRSILHDDDLYSIKKTLDANVSPKDAVKGLVRARTSFRGSGQPTLFISDSFLTDIMLEEDKFGRALYESNQALADKLRVVGIVPVEIFDEYPSVVAIMVNLQDYTIGSNRGGELTSFEDFDIDFNQHKYLQETRLSGGLTKPYSAVVVFREQGTLATATAPSFDGATNTITIPTATGVSYFDSATDAELTGDVVITKETEVVARADEGYYLEPNSTNSWTYTP